MTHPACLLHAPILRLIQHSRLEAQMTGCRIVETGQVEIIVVCGCDRLIHAKVQVNIRFVASKSRTILIQRCYTAAVGDGLDVVLVRMIRLKQGSLKRVLSIVSSQKDLKLNYLQVL